MKFETYAHEDVMNYHPLLFVPKGQTNCFDKMYPMTYLLKFFIFCWHDSNTIRYIIANSLIHFFVKLQYMCASPVQVIQTRS